MADIPTIEQMKLNGRLPSPKGVALAIMELCRRDDTTIDAIVKVVCSDPSLSGQILRAANMAALGGRPVASIPEAITRLGLVAVRQLATGFSLVGQYHEGPCKNFDYARFWSHSLLMAVAIRELGGLTRIASPDELFACGLLTRIGCLALATLYPVAYAELLERHSQGGDMLEMEREVLNTDHLEVTRLILADYGIPKALVEPLCHHENPDASGFTEGSRPFQLAQLFYQAKRLADLGMAPERERNGAIVELMLLAGKIGQDVDCLGEMFDRIVGLWREWAQLLEVPAIPPPPFATMAAAPASRAEAESDVPNLRVLLVEDDPTSLMLMESYLGDILGHAVHTATDGREALAKALEVMPQIVVTDWLMPVMDGIDFTRALRATDWGQSMYVIMLTSVETEQEIVMAFEAGVDDYITKPVNGRAIRARMRAAMHYVNLLENWERDRAQLKQFAAELAISNRKLEHYAHTDQLTGLYNRRAGMDNLAQAWSNANRSGQPVAAMMIDIDHFKSVNDDHGHAIGDVVLVEVAKCIQQSARKDDFVCRMGGEEFLIICHSADLKAAYQAAERLRMIVRGLEIQVANARIKISVSVGVAGKEPAIADMEGLISAADKALYAAKHAGRDRTCLITGGKLRCGNS